MSVQPLRVMLSSRNRDSIPFPTGKKPTLTEIRTDLKKTIESIKFGSSKLFDVWINEDARPAAGTEDWWQHCLNQAEEADIVIVLYNGVAGDSKTGSDIGICHAELEAAMRAGSARVHLVELPDCSGKATKSVKKIDAGFHEYINDLGLFRGASAKAVDEVTARVMEALTSAVSTLTRRGRSSAQKDKYDRGQALEWHRLSFVERQTTMRSALKEALLAGHLATDLGADLVQLRVDLKPILIQVSAVPGAMTVSEARELLGRPHLRDHLLQDDLAKAKRTLGPLHVIACHRAVTESQALKILGFPDAVTITSGFGVFVADNVQMAQLVFLRECRDKTALRQSTQLFMDWLNTSGEGHEIIRRATSRKEVVKVIAGAQVGGTK